MRIVNRKKGYLWPLDILCCECRSNIHLSKSEDLDKVSSDGETKYFCTCPKCGERYSIPSDRIPEDIRNKI